MLVSLGVICNDSQRKRLCNVGELAFRLPGTDADCPQDSVKQYKVED